MNIHLPAILMFTRGTRVLTHCHVSIMFSSRFCQDVQPEQLQCQELPGGAGGRFRRAQTPWIFNAALIGFGPCRNAGFTWFYLGKWGISPAKTGIAGIQPWFDHQKVWVLLLPSLRLGNRRFHQPNVIKKDIWT